MRTRTLIASLIAALVAVLVGSASVQASSTSVSIDNMAFSPATVTIHVGDTVTWTNHDSVAHTVTGGGFDSGTLNPGQSYSHTFTATGTFTYHCSFHAGMAGVVRVTATTSPTTPAPPAERTPSGVPDTGA